MIRKIMHGGSNPSGTSAKKQPACKNGLLFLIDFVKNYKEFIFLKETSPILKDEQNWKSGELLDFDLHEYISFAMGNPNILNIHTPEKITLEYYLLAKNSVGFSNLNIEA